MRHRSSEIFFSSILSDFRKDQLKVHFGNNGVLTVSGERPPEGSKWIRFSKEFATPKDCKPTEIRARFCTNLYITVPKEIAPSHAETVPPLLPVQDKGKLDQQRNIRQSGGVTDEMAPPEWSISSLKIEGKTATKIVASLIVTAILIVG
ncbi:inactive protein RESTRICTED TEV MOVEMENT 2-like [Hibiscus syriacus]|uniref:inactive protein RESTRICTED TEV MOVEMENT 2-like n=1 Tax=Hibiscus syriacus TaxID=106335 RepID=UPI001920C244|nr:inactive protein RESTRICTED TEV MOVEMENT 2-like [Hibiscus syriacus]